MPRYVPEPTPTGDSLAELQRYIDQELQRISESVNVKVDRAYGGIFQTAGSFVFSPLTPAGELFNPFDVATPQAPDGVQPVPVSASLVVLSGGAYNFSFATQVINIPPNAEYGFLLAKNGVSTGLGGVVAPSNQTESVTVAFSILVNAQKGDLYTMLINSPTSTNAEVIGSEFSTNRVSEEQ